MAINSNQATGGDTPQALTDFLSEPSSSGYSELNLDSVGSEDTYDDVEQDAPVQRADNKKEAPAKEAKASAQTKKSKEEADFEAFLNEDEDEDLYEEGELTDEENVLAEEEEGEVEEDGDDKQEDSEEDPAALDEGEDSDEEGEGRDGEDEDELLSSEKKESRIPKRIGQLINKLKEKDTAFANKEYEYIQLIQQLAVENRQFKKQTAEGAKALAESRLTKARAELKEATEIGDTDSQIKAQEDLADAKVSLQEATRLASTVGYEEEPIRLTPEQVIATRKATEWANTNKVALSHPKIKETALRLSTTLIAEGFHDSSDEYWDELNTRLNKLVISPKYKVKGIYSFDEYNTPAPTQKKAVAKQAPAPQPKKKAPVALKAPPKRKSASITLDAGEEAFIRNTNSSKELYLRQKAAVKRTQTDNGYTPVIL